MIALRTSGFIILGLLSANLVFLFHNTIIYLIPLKIKSVLLAQFYILAGIITIARIIEVSYFVSWKYLSGFMDLSYDDGYTSTQEWFDTIGSMANVALSSLFVATMY